MASSDNKICAHGDGCRFTLLCSDTEVCLLAEGSTRDDRQQRKAIGPVLNVQRERMWENPDGFMVSSALSPLPIDSQERKNTPIYSGVLRYFPRALAYIAKVSKAGNDKHNPGQPLHWSKGKSNDHGDCVARHLIEAGTRDPDDGLLHSGKLAWRALALLETELEGAEKISVDRPV